MPPRLFDSRRLRVLRRGKDLTQKQVGTHLGVSDAAVARWEKGQDFPPGEKLPALAQLLGRPLDELFPRKGLPDLADLRCDAGYNQRQASEIIGTSRVPLSNAERGKRRLDPAYVQPLAQAYGVGSEDLLAAQERSFGNQEPQPLPEPRPIPQTLADKITYLLEHTFPDRQAPTDGEMARVINAKAGRPLVTDQDVRALRTDGETSVNPEDPAVLEGLAQVFSVSHLFFQPNEAVARQVTEAIRFLASIQRGTILGLGARGNDGGGLPADMIARINDLVADIQRGKIPGADPDEDRP